MMKINFNLKINLFFTNDLWWGAGGERDTLPTNSKLLPVLCVTYPRARISPFVQNNPIKGEAGSYPHGETERNLNYVIKE